MKKTLLILSLLSICAAIAPAQSATNKTAETSVASDKNIEQTIMRLFREVDEAEGRADVARLDQMFVDGAFMTFPDGSVISKTQYLNYWKTNPLKTKFEYKYEDVKILANGVTAVLSCRWTATPIGGQDEQFGPYQVTSTWTKQGGTWKTTTFHASNARTTSGPHELIEQKEKATWDLLKKKKYDEWIATLAENYHAEYAEGTVDRKKEIEMAKILELADYTISDMNVTFPSADSATVTYKIDLRGKSGSQDISGKYDTTSVWTKTNGQWLFLMNRMIAMK